MKRTAVMVAGLAFGDEGKGATVDFLCRSLNAKLVVRYNGGSQAAHNVVTSAGVHHTFAQFGAGMLAAPDVRTHLSRFMLVDPLTMLNEARALEQLTPNVWERTSVDPRCVIITPFHKVVNRLRETTRGIYRHGSCGMGLGVAREWELRNYTVIRTIDVRNERNGVRNLLRAQRDAIANILGEECIKEISIEDVIQLYAHWVGELNGRVSVNLPRSEVTVFEGAQGVLLDEHFGIEPFRTWTDCTFKPAEWLCRTSGIERMFRLGCFRSYFTRHGPGPFPTEIQATPGELNPALTILPTDVHNTFNEWQREFRVGAFDMKLAKEALTNIGGVDGLVINHMEMRFANNVAKRISEELDAPIVLEGHGTTAEHRKVRHKSWLEALIKERQAAEDDAVRGIAV